MEKPRPSRNTGKSTAITRDLVEVGDEVRGFVVGREPHAEFFLRARCDERVLVLLPQRERHDAPCRRAAHRLRAVRRLRRHARRCQSSSTTARFLIIKAICKFLDWTVVQACAWRDAYTRSLNGAMPMRPNVSMKRSPSMRFSTNVSITCDDHVGHLFRRERRADHLAEMRAGRARALLAAERHLIPLRAVLIDAQHADVADVVMTARVDAARDVERQVAEVVHVVEIVETLLNGQRDRDRLRVRERAEIAARARDDVGQQADVRRRETERLRAFPHGVQVALLHVRENQVLLVRHADFAEREFVGEIGDVVHLLVGCVARRRCRVGFSDSVTDA